MLFFQTKYHSIRQFILRQAHFYHVSLKESVLSLGINDHNSDIQILSLELLKNNPVPNLRLEVEKLLEHKKEIIQHEARLVLERLLQ